VKPLTILLFLIMIQAYETQPYKVVKKYDAFELRYYPSARMVTTESPANSDQNFNALFQYISGANEENLKIAMTTPVHMSQKEGQKKMSFVLPNQLKDPPLPKNQKIRLTQSKAGYYAALQYGGYSNSSKTNYYTEQLKAALLNENIKILGSPLFLGYNSPYKFFNRRNEILLEVFFSPKKSD